MKYIFAKGKVFATARVEQREQSKRLSDQFAGQFGHQGTDFLRLAVNAVQPRRNTHNLLRQIGHKDMGFRPAGNRKPVIYVL